MELYDCSDPRSIETYAKKLVSHTFLEVLEGKVSDREDIGEAPEADATIPETASEYGNQKRNGGLGNLLEEAYFGDVRAASHRMNGLLPALHNVKRELFITKQSSVGRLCRLRQGRDRSKTPGGRNCGEQLACRGISFSVRQDRVAAVPPSGNRDSGSVLFPVEKDPARTFLGDLHGQGPERGSRDLAEFP